MGSCSATSGSSAIESVGDVGLSGRRGWRTARPPPADPGARVRRPRGPLTEDEREARYGADPLGWFAPVFRRSPTTACITMFS
jgi:hypothetical protein